MTNRKTVGENEEEMRQILLQALTNKEAWAIKLVEMHGSVSATVKIN